MSLSDVSIRRPVFATILNAVIIVFGMFGYSKIGIDQFPNVDFPVVVIQIPYPGADPTSIEQKILEPLERGLAGVSSLETLNSTAYPNLAQITLQFKLERDGDKAAQDVRDKMSTLLSQLPKEAEQPVISKFDVSGQPIVILNLSSKTSNLAALSRLADDTIRPQIEQVAGVGSINLIGNREREIHIYLNRAKIQAFNLSPLQIQSAVEAQIAEVPSGRIENSANLIRIRTEGTLSTADQIARLPIMLPSGATIRIADVADVQDTLEREVSYATANGTSTILLNVFKQSGGNTVAVAKGVVEKLENMRKQLPPGVELSISKNNSEYINGLIGSVRFDLVLGALLAIVIVLIFLHDWRATVISALAIPTSVIGTFAFINYLGFTLNIMTTLGLTLSIGILVDDAIVVVENIYRHLKMGKSPIDAAKDGTNEIGMAVFAITLSLISVFVPVAFMDGIVGRFFFQFGITVAVAVVLSLFVAFTLTPMVSSRILKGGGHGDGHKTPKIFVPFDNGLNKLDKFYHRVLEGALHRRFITILVGFLILIASGIMLRYVPAAFFPKEDKGELQVVYELKEGTSITEMKVQAATMQGFLQKYPGVHQIIMYIGSGAEKKPNLATFEVTLVGKHDRSFSQEDMIQRLRKDLEAKKRPGERFEVNAASGGGGRPQPIQLILQGADYEKLSSFANETKQFVATGVPGATDVSTTEPARSDEIRVISNPLLAADLGLSTAQIGNSLRSLFEGIKVGEVLTDGLRYDVKVQAAEADAAHASDLSGLSLPNAKGVQIDLSSVAAVETIQAPSKIDRRGGQKQITILANFTGKDEGGANRAIEEHVKAKLPPGITYAFDGSSKLFKEAVAAILLSMGLAILLVYMVLCAQFESYTTPFVIMMSVPLAFSGAFLALLITQQTMSIYAMIGLIMLIGLVTKNAILLIDFTLQSIREGMSVHDALLHAGPIRLRPILMTTAAMIFGMMPIAIGHGAGGEARAPMAVCVIGGLISSTVLTLVVIPCVFSALQDFLAWKSRLFSGRKKKVVAHA